MRATAPAIAAASVGRSARGRSVSRRATPRRAAPIRRRGRGAGRTSAATVARTAAGEQALAARR
eukprot:11189242-Alexandrium_andersonii.AAC.1